MAHGGEEAALGGIRALGFLARVLDRLLLDLAVGDVAHHRHDLALALCVIALGAIERTAAHFNPNELSGALAVGRGVAPDAEFDRTAEPLHGGIGKRRQVGRPVTDMHAVEQAVTEQRFCRHAEQAFGRR